MMVDLKFSVGSEAGWRPNPKALFTLHLAGCSTLSACAVVKAEFAC